MRALSAHLGCLVAKSAEDPLRQAREHSKRRPRKMELALGGAGASERSRNARGVRLSRSRAEISAIHGSVPEMGVGSTHRL
eukprot:1207180-Prymnesium_polylepis.2